MKFKVGDTVKFLNETGSGEIVSIIDKNSALVKIEDGFDIPVLMKNLVLSEGTFREETITNKDRTEDPAMPETETEIYEDIEDEEVLLAFVPEQNSSEFENYLVNSSSYFIKYVISREQGGEQVLYCQGDLEPGIKILLRKYQPVQLSEAEHFRIQVLFYHPDHYKHLSPVDMIVSFQAGEMYDAHRRVENDYFDERAVMFNLFSWKKTVEIKMELDAEEIKKAMFTKGDVKTARKAKSQENTGPEEVDLHIENLVDDHSKMENAEILEIQLARFRSSLESALIQKTKRVVFIHGVGNGKLKYELRKILDTEYKKLRYQDASFKEYGFGATMVLI